MRAHAHNTLCECHWVPCHAVCTQRVLSINKCLYKCQILGYVSPRPTEIVEVPVQYCKHGLVLAGLSSLAHQHNCTFVTLEGASNLQKTHCLNSVLHAHASTALTNAIMNTCCS